DNGRRLIQPGKHVVNGCEQLAPLFHFKIPGLGNNDSFMSDRQSRRLPGGESAVQHVNVLVAEEFKKPEQARGTHAGDIVVDDNGAVGVDALRLNQVLDEPQVGFERFGPGIDKAYPEDVETSRSRNVPVGVRFGRPQIEYDEPWILKS